MNESISFKTIKLERTGCYGPCPIYKVSIHHTGRVTYTGYLFVEKTGRHIWKINAATVNKLNKALQSADYFKIQKCERDLFYTDMPSCITIGFDSK